MPKMVATKRQTYGGKNISDGDVFHVSVHHVRLLKALGRVTDMATVGAMTAENTSALVPSPAREQHVVAEQPRTHVVEQERHVEESKPVVESAKEEAEPDATVDEQVENTVEHDVEDTQPPEPSILDLVEEPAKEEAMPTTSQPAEYSAMLRNRARALGIRVDGRWSDERVQREIDEYNKRTYQRMDIRATE